MGLEDYKKEYEEFWKPLIENEDGTINKDKLMRELSDYSWLMEAASKVYCHVTDSKTGNVKVLPDVVIGLYEDSLIEYAHNITKEVVEEILDIIENRRKSALEDASNIKNKNSCGYGYALGEFDGLGYLKDEIKEQYDMDTEKN